MFTTGDTGYGTSPATPPQGHQPPPGFLAVNRAGGGVQLATAQQPQGRWWWGAVLPDYGVVWTVQYGSAVGGSNNLGAGWDDLVSGSSTLTRSSNHPMFSQGGRGCSYCMTSGMSGVPSVKASEWGLARIEWFRTAALTVMWPAWLEPDTSIDNLQHCLQHGGEKRYSLHPKL